MLCMVKQWKTWENRTDVRLVSNKKRLFKIDIKTKLYVIKIDNNLVAVCERKVSLKLNKPAYFGICILGLSQLLMYVLQYDYIENNYFNKSRLLITDIDSLKYEIKSKDVYKDFSKVKEMFDLGNYSAKSKYDNDLNKLVVDKMKEKTAGVSIKKFVGLKPELYSFLVDDSREHKKESSVNKNDVAKTSHNEYKDVLYNSTCLKRSMNRIQIRNRKKEPVKLTQFLCLVLMKKYIS